MKTLLKSTTIAVLAAMGFSSCAGDPYYANGGYGTQSVAPALATGVAIAALAGYANERQSRRRSKAASWAYSPYNPYRYGGGHGGYHRPHCYR